MNGKKTLSLFVLLCLVFQLFSLTAFAYTEIKGDVNNDGKISLLDARAVLRSVAQIEVLPDESLPLADYDGDGVLTFEDARKILNASIDLPPEYVGIEKFAQLTPKKSNDGITGKAKFCMVLNNYSETLAATPVDNKSNPLYSPLLAGTFDYIKEGPLKDSSSGHEFYVLKSGRRVYTDAVDVFTGFKMPLNNIEIMNYIETLGSDTQFYLKLDWRVPFNVTIKPQAYEKGYNSREYNLTDGKFTATYMDITFYKSIVIVAMMIFISRLKIVITPFSVVLATIYALACILMTYFSLKAFTVAMYFATRPCLHQSRMNWLGISAEPIRTARNT